MATINPDEIEVTYNNFHQNKSDGCLRCMKSKVTKLEDIQAGNFIIPKDAYSVSFSYNKQKSININGEEFKKKELIRTGKFYEDAELYTLEDVKNLGNDHIYYYQAIVTRNASHFVKTKHQGTLIQFREDDVIVTGKNGEWKVVARHPNAPIELPEYLSFSNDNQDEDLIEQANLGRRTLGSRL